MAQPRTILGVDPGAAVRKLLGDKSADVIPSWDGGGKIQTGNLIGSINTVGAGNYSEPVNRNSTPGHLQDLTEYYDDPWYQHGSRTVNNTSTPSGPDAAAQAEAARMAQIRADADPLYKTLSSLDTIRNNNRQGVMDTYQQQIREYNDLAAQDRSRYEENVSNNEGQLQSQRQNKMLSGARLNQGLNSILASMGALNGTGQFLAGQAVQGITNRGLGEAGETFETNARNINSAWSEAEKQARQREARAQEIRDDQLANTDADIFGRRQQILNQLANLYGTDTSQGRGYMAQAGALSADIARTTRPNVAQYQEASSLYSPDALQEYLSGIGNTQVQSAGGDQTGGRTPINSPLFAGNNRRRDERLA